MLGILPGSPIRSDVLSDTVTETQQSGACPRLSYQNQFSCEVVPAGSEPVDVDS